MTKYLDVFNKYCDLLDEEFDDSLIVEYKNVDKPNFIIIYDPTVDIKLLDKSIPKEWRDLEKNKEIILDIRMYQNKEGRYEYIRKSLLKRITRWNGRIL